MMKICVRTMLATAIMAVLMQTGCAYSHVRRPLDLDFDETELGAKEGKSSAYSVVWLFAWGDAGTRAAAENGNIKIIRHADTEMLSIMLGLYTRIDTIVYGD